MQIHNGCKIVVLVGCYEHFFQTKLFGGTSSNGRIGLSRDMKSLLPNNIDKKLKIFVFSFLPFLFHYNIIF